MSDSEEEEAPDTKLKLIIVGDGTSGKTSIVTRYIQDQFGKQYVQTVGIDFYLKRIVLPGEKYVSLQIWDVGGETLGGQMLDKYIYGAQGILFVYDISNQQSFENVKNWLSSSKEILKGMPCHFALVGNKCDLEHVRTVRRSVHEAYAEAQEMSSHLVCAKTGDSVALCFKKVAANILNIKLSRAEMDEAHKVVKAVIEETGESKPTKATVRNRKTKSSICSLQ